MTCPQKRSKLASAPPTIWELRRDKKESATEAELREGANGYEEDGGMDEEEEERWEEMEGWA